MAAERSIGRSKGDMATTAHAICNKKGHARKSSTTAGNMNDFDAGSTLLTYRQLPPVKAAIAGRGYDTRWIRDVVLSHGMELCISSRRTVKIRANYFPPLSAARHRVENFFAKLKDSTRIATRCDRCPRHFLASLLIISFLFLSDLYEDRC
jgi:transposase